MSTIEVLRTAKALIEDPARWTTGACARSRDGRTVDSVDPHACCWCAFGAAIKASADLRCLNRLEHYEAETLLDDAAVQLFGKVTQVVVNDELGHAAVMQMYDKAIELAEADQ